MIELAPRPRALRILCVEENGLERKLLQACLDVVQIEAVFALTGTEAVAHFCRHPVDMVFIDIDRHTARELGCFRRMRTVPGRGMRVPIVAVTDNDCHWSEEDYRDAGFTALFVKPIEPSRLFHIIDDVLHRSDQPPLLTPRPSAHVPHVA